ncbi:MAG TPA: squalene synthase HpnC [Alphaproteobacteria bacterium]
MTLTTAAPIAETPSGKGAGDENFPVGSFLLPKALRPKVAIFYAYARAIDDIADNPELPAQEKIARLDGFDRALTGASDDPAYAKAIRIRETMAGIGDIIRHCRDLIVAFKQDAVKLRYKDWDDLMGYCIKSAAPVGRFLLDLHACPRSGYPASDALCNALQVINHLQDCKEDFRRLNRVYLPTDWLAAEGSAVEDLDRPAASPGLRRALDRCLDATDLLLREAQRLPRQLTSRRLAMESAAILRLAEKLSAMLRRRDPLAERVALGKPGFLLYALLGVGRYWLGP